MNLELSCPKCLDRDKYQIDDENVIWKSNDPSRWFEGKWIITTNCMNCGQEFSLPIFPDDPYADKLAGEFGYMQEINGTYP